MMASVTWNDTNTLSSDTAMKYNRWCEQFALLHERRVSDALANSDYIDWTQIKLADTKTRLNYTETVDKKLEQKIVCDVLLKYRYAEKSIAIPTTFTISEPNRIVLSDLTHIEETVFEFIVKLMV